MLKRAIFFYAHVITRSGAIACLADGDARIAIQTLKAGAYLAENSDKKEVSALHVERAWNSAKELKKTYLLRRLTDHHRLLYELIAENAGILSGDLRRLYLKTCNARKIKPIAIRTHLNYCNKLVELGLVQAKRVAIRGKSRTFNSLM